MIRDRLGMTGMTRDALDDYRSLRITGMTRDD